MMESVEDIPARSILDGLPWNWETYGEYLEWLDRTPKGVNVGGMVGHSALRYYAMGERSLDEDATPTADELERDDEAARRGADRGCARLLELAHVAPPGARRPVRARARTRRPTSSSRSPTCSRATAAA